MAYTTIKKPSDYFNTVLYTGNAGTQSITGVGFSPDFIWGKNRSSVTHHALVDTVRGNTKYVKSSTTAAEATITNMVTSFDSDGFSLGADSDMNGSSANQVAWNWLANGAGVANTDGTISSTVSANTTAGFSIATWSGTGSNGSIGHGLGGVDCMIIKDLSNARDFYFWNKSMAYNTRLELNNTETFTTGTDNMTALPDATKINMAVSTQNNGSGNNYVGYFFQEKQGFSKFGSYTGNGSTDGTFVYTGFKPAWIMVKRTDATEVWHILDNKRDTFNKNADWKYLDPASSGAEYDNNQHDFLSNGFKMRATGANSNASGGSFIYMAFAEQPLVGDNPATAR